MAACFRIFLLAYLKAKLHYNESSPDFLGVLTNLNKDQMSTCVAVIYVKFVLCCIVEVGLMTPQENK